MASQEQKMSWQDIAAQKRQALRDSIPAEWRIPADLLPSEQSQPDVTTFPAQSGWFTPAELAITTTPAAELLAKLRAREWTAEEVARAFCKRASAAHQLINCLSETLFDLAIATARSLDAHLARTGTPLGPLHGLPISLKDNIDIAGVDSTLGFTSRVHAPAPRNAVLADLLLAAGAVPYVKTNVPTAMMYAETVNQVFGPTRHPRHPGLTPGGSSGGEAALIAFGGSVLGVGSDIGGSLRIPAACTGLWTLRPSAGRFPTGRCSSGLPGQEAVASVNGPLAPCLDTLRLYARAVVDAEPWRKDPKCLPIPWRDVQAPKKLRVGVLWHDGVVEPHPPVRRALQETVDKLRKAGHEVVDWSCEGHKRATELIHAFFHADGGATIASLLAPSHEPLPPYMHLYAPAAPLSIAELWQLQAERTALQAAYLERWNEAGLDAVLCPTMPYAAVPKGRFGYFGYTCVWNCLDYAAVNFPVGVRVGEGAGVGGWDREGEEGDGDAEAVEEMLRGQPVSLQLVAGRLEEEKLL
ncbi:uncharacterized protein K452DRAFT_246754, partial [Aplosporella prunicola CBS 121167]